MNKFLKKASVLKPCLTITEHTLKKCVSLVNGESTVFDFSTHITGKVKLLFSFKGVADSPVLIKIFFAEYAKELEEDTDKYNGWVSKSWIQEEIVHIDKFPSTISLPRRYAFRYVKINVLSAPQNGQTIVKAIRANAGTSAPEKLLPRGETEEERAIDAVSLKTLSECMQEVFEDGVKRDRRLWLGDLRLQALANYYTFQHNDLVKRCLYLFAGTRLKDGRLCQSIFNNGRGDGQTNFDYPLLFIPTLADYLAATGDLDTIHELLPIAVSQIEAARKFFENDMLIDRPLGWCFLDWSFTLNRQAGACGVFLYAERSLIGLLKTLGLDSKEYELDYERKAKRARETFYDEQRGLVTSGEAKQISYASAVWFVLAEILSAEEGRRVLNNIQTNKEAVKPVTPYLMHHYVQALIDCGMMNEARKVLNDYWGGMVRLGADTFWELFNPENPNETPYGGTAVLSYCHAWSCTPCFFYRKYFCN